MLDHGREVLATTPLDAEPDVILKMPGDTLLPLLLALALVGVLHRRCLRICGGWRSHAESSAAHSFSFGCGQEPSLGQTAEPRHV